MQCSNALFAARRCGKLNGFGVLVDICPSCKGIWLDRGELDKIIQYATSGYKDEVAPAYDPYEPASYEPTPPPQQPYQHRQPSHQQPYSQQPPQQHYQPKRKKRFSEFLEELFDIFD